MSIKAGWLVKQGGRIKTWKRRFFSLTENKLIYSKSPGLPPKGEITINDSEMVSLARECKKQPAFRIQSFRRGKKRTFYMCAESQEVANSWVETLKRVANGQRLDDQVDYLDDLETVRTLVEKANGGKIEIVQMKGRNHQFCLKRYPRSLFKSKANDVLDEMSKYLKIQNPYVVPLLYLPQDARELGFIYEYTTHGCLFGLLWEEGKFSEDRTALYAAELACGLSFMHKEGVVYGDICPSSVLLMNDGHIRIPDTGLCSSKKPISAYTAPEILVGKAATCATDWYCYGVLVYEMLTGMSPFYAETEQEMRSAIANGTLLFPHHVSKPARDFVQRLMKKDPSERLGAEFDDIKNHAFFGGISWESIEEKSTEPFYIPSESRNIYYTVSFEAF